MGDTKQSRDKQAHDEDDRARQRAVEEELARFHETEPPRDLEDALEDLEYPVAAEDLATAVETFSIEAPEDVIPAAEVVEHSGTHEYDSAAAARQTFKRPAVAASLRRLRDVSRSAGLKDGFLEREDVYRTTLRALEDVDADDDDEGVAAVTAWIVAEMQDEQRLPSSRKTRQRGAAFCRERGYEIRDDSWLGA
jgi:hypothetical protein